MKIAILIDLLVPGGVQKAAIEEVQNLRKSGHTAALFCLTRTRADYQYHDLLKGLLVRYLSDYHPRCFQKAFRIPCFTFLTTNHLLAPFFTRRYKILKNFDLVIAHGTTTCLTAMQISQSFNIPYLAFIWDPMGFILHTVYQDSPLKNVFPLVDIVIRHLERQFLKHARLVITPSAVHQRVLATTYGIDATIIPPGHDFSLPKTRGKPNYVLGYSRWQKEKHPDFFLKLAQSINFPILLAGDWTNSQELRVMRAKIKQANLNIKIVKSVQHQDIPRLASHALCWVHPNFEAFGMAGLELAALGIPIVIPQGSGLTELFENGKHGFFPPPRNWQAMIRAIQTLINNPKTTQQMGEKAAQVAQHYTWKEHTQRLIEAVEHFRQAKAIVVLHNAFVTTKSIGGGDLFMISLATRLKQPNQTIITPEIGYYHWRQAQPSGLKFKLVPATRFDGSESPLEIFLAYLIRSLKSITILNILQPIDIIISATELLPDIVPAFWYHRLHPKTRWIARIFHLVPPPHKRKGNFLVNTASLFLQRTSLLMMRSCDCILVDNPILKQELIELGIPPQKIEVHSGGVDVKKISNYTAKKTESFTAAYVGRLNPHKGIFDLVPIWKRVVKVLPNAKLAIIGTGPVEIQQKLQEQIRRAHLEKSIILLGFREHEKGQNMPLFDILKHTKLLLFTDHEAGFGLIVAEAMATGLPIVAYHLPIFGEIYKQGFVTAPLGDTAQFASEILSLLTDAKRYRILKSLAIRQAEAFDWKHATWKFEKLIHRLLT